MGSRRQGRGRSSPPLPCTQGKPGQNLYSLSMSFCIFDDCHAPKANLVKIHTLYLCLFAFCVLLSCCLFVCLSVLSFWKLLICSQHSDDNKDYDDDDHRGCLMVGADSKGFLFHYNLTIKVDQCAVQKKIERKHRRYPMVLIHLCVRLKIINFV